MIFDTIYTFFNNLFSSADDISTFWASGYFELGDGTAIAWNDYLATIGTVVTIALGVVSLFRILGGILKLFKV